MCLTAAELENILGGEPVSPMSSDHLRHCRICQGELDRLSDDPELRGWAGQSTPMPPAELMNRWRGLIDAAATPGRSVTLDPPIRPGDLGAIGPYLIEEEIGRGGMSAVFRAFDPILRRFVAIKLMFPTADDSQARLRLMKEAQSLAQLRHPNIVEVYSASETGCGQPYLVMELIVGRTLAQTIVDQTPRPNVIADLIAAAADGVHAAHQIGLIHRDLKPDNLIVTDHRAHSIKVADFGLVRSNIGTRTASGILAGTPAYMSPEQIREPERIDHRADIYSLGATLYECLSGQPPFRGSSAAVLQQVLFEEPPPPRRFNDRVPRDLEVICLRAMAKERHRRFTDAAELAADLRRWLNNEPILARPTSALERLGRWCGRNPLPAGLIASLAIVAVSGASGIAWQWRSAIAEASEANRQRNEAEDNLREAAAAVDQLLTRVSQEKLLDVPGMEPLRRQLLEDALRYYERLVAKPSAGVHLQVETAKAASRVAELVRLLRTPAESVAAWDRALACWNRCIGQTEAFDSVLSCRLNRALALSRADRIDEAQSSFEELLPLLHDRAAKHPEQVKHQRDLASVAGALASIHDDRGQTELATSAFHSTCAAFQRIVDAYPDSAADHHRLAFYLNRTGMLRPASEALPLFDRARSAQSKALSLGQRAPAGRYLLARIEHHRGVALGELGRAAEARAAMSHACAELQELVDGSPEVFDYRKSLASALHWLGASQADCGLDEAGPTLRRAWKEYARLNADPNGKGQFQDSINGIDAYRRKIGAEPFE